VAASGVNSCDNRMSPRHRVPVALVLAIGIGCVACGRDPDVPPPGDSRDADRGETARDVPDSAPPPADATPDFLAGDAGVDVGRDGAPAAACDETAGGAWADWPMPDPAVHGTPSAQSYDTSAPGVVLDQVTHLMWQRTVAPVTQTWSGAKQYCACLQLGGHDDWRLPSRIELVSIVDFTRHTPSIDSIAFPDTPLEWFWTSTALAENPEEAWYIYFDNGFSKFILAEEHQYRVRCVRSPPLAPPLAPPPMRYEVAAETVRDTKTGLTWQRKVDPTRRNWAAAKAYCAQLALAGGAAGSWRLPSMRELQSLVDERRFEPAIDPDAFPDTPPVEFWTGNVVSGAPDSAWRVTFANGYTYDATATLEFLARCVR
jgi:hypothetical protein